MILAPLLLLVGTLSSGAWGSPLSDLYLIQGKAAAEACCSLSKPCLKEGLQCLEGLAVRHSQRATQVLREFVASFGASQRQDLSKACAGQQGMELWACIAAHLPQASDWQSVRSRLLFEEALAQGHALRRAKERCESAVSGYKKKLPAIADEVERLREQQRPMATCQAEWKIPSAWADVPPTHRPPEAEKFDHSAWQKRVAAQADRVGVLWDVCTPPLREKLTEEQVHSLGKEKKKDAIVALTEAIQRLKGRSFNADDSTAAASSMLVKSGFDQNAEWRACRDHGRCDTVDLRSAGPTEKKHYQELWQEEALRLAHLSAFPEIGVATDSEASGLASQRGAEKVSRQVRARAVEQWEKILLRLKASDAEAMPILWAALRYDPRIWMAPNGSIDAVNCSLANGVFHPLQERKESEEVSRQGRLLAIAWANVRLLPEEERERRLLALSFFRSLGVDGWGVLQEGFSFFPEAVAQLKRFKKKEIAVAQSAPRAAPAQKSVAKPAVAERLIPLDKPLGLVGKPPVVTANEPRKPLAPVVRPPTPDPETLPRTDPLIRAWAAREAGHREFAAKDWRALENWVREGNPATLKKEDIRLEVLKKKSEAAQKALVAYWIDAWLELDRVPLVLEAGEETRRVIPIESKGAEVSDLIQPDPALLLLDYLIAHPSRRVTVQSMGVYGPKRRVFVRSVEAGFLGTPAVSVQDAAKAIVVSSRRLSLYSGPSRSEWLSRIAGALSPEDNAAFNKRVQALDDRVSLLKQLTGS